MYCQKCGAQNPDNGNFCLNCGAPLINQQTTYVISPTTQSSIPQHTHQQNKKNNKSSIIVIIAVVAVLFVSAIVAITFFDRNDDRTISSSSSVQVKASTKAHSTTETTTETPTLTAKEFKADCKTIPYKDIARQPEKYYDEKLVYTGRIFQVSQKQDDGMYYALVNVTKDEYDYYDDAIYIGFELKDGEPKFLEDDIITFYGVGRGDMSYESVLGNEITVPAVWALYIELEK